MKWPASSATGLHASSLCAVAPSSIASMAQLTHPRGYGCGTSQMVYRFGPQCQVEYVPSPPLLPTHSQMDWVCTLTLRTIWRNVTHALQGTEQDLNVKLAKVQRRGSRRLLRVRPISDRLTIRTSRRISSIVPQISGDDGPRPPTATGCTCASFHSKYWQDCVRACSVLESTSAPSFSRINTLKAVCGV